MLDAALTLLYPGRRLHEQQVREALCLSIVGSHFTLQGGTRPVTVALVQEAAAYFEMARLVNLVPSCVLVYLGAWVSHSPT